MSKHIQLQHNMHWQNLQFVCYNCHIGPSLEYQGLNVYFPVREVWKQGTSCRGDFSQPLDCRSRERTLFTVHQKNIGPWRPSCYAATRLSSSLHHLLQCICPVALRVNRGLGGHAQVSIAIVKNRWSSFLLFFWFSGVNFSHVLRCPHLRSVGIATAGCQTLLVGEIKENNSFISHFIFDELHYKNVM